MWYINSQKDERCARIIFSSATATRWNRPQKVYQAYQEARDRAGLVDFAELLLLRCARAVAQ